jgi:hypothetical protein
MVIHLRRAATVFGDSSYRTMLNTFPDKVARSDRSVLFYP